MKIKPLRLKLSLFIVSVFACLGLLGSQNAFAATVTWDGGGDASTWNDGDNWSTNAIPVDGDDIVINCAGPSACASIADIAGLSVSSLSFTGAGETQVTQLVAADVTLTGNITAATPGSFFTAPLVLGADSVATNVQLGSLNLNGFAFTLTGSGGLRSNGANPAGPGGWIGIGGVITGDGVLNIEADADQEVYLGCSGDANTYTGTTNVTSGLFVSNGCSDIIAGDYVASGGTGDRLTLFGSSDIFVGPEGKIRFTMDETDDGSSFSNTLILDRTGGAGSQLEFYNHSSNSTDIAVAFPVITLLSDNRFSANTDGGGLIVDLAGIASNDNCLEYGDADDSQLANFLNGPDCTPDVTPPVDEEVTDNTNAVPKGVGNAGFEPDTWIAQNPVIIGGGGLAIAGAAFAVIRRMILGF